MIVRAGSDEIVLHHGRFVETRDVGFVEGAWDGEFEPFGFERSELLMGSGVRLVGDQMVIATSSHTLEPIFSHHVGDSLYVSNSLAFVLRMSGSSLSVAHIPYHTDLASIILGLDDCVRAIPTAQGGTVRLHYFTNLLVDRKLNVVEQAKPSPESFVDFRTYRDYLLDRLRRIFDNASSPGRRARFEPILTGSSGYDSVACAALAGQAGCRHAVTITQFKPDGPNDSFKPIGEKLGYERITEYCYDEYRDIRPFAEVEAFASGAVTLSRFEVFEEECRQSLLITGVYGDVVWDKDNAECGRFRRKPLYLGGVAGLTEWRLRTGIILLPLPYFGGIQHASIHRISNSDEMKPWVVGGDYDRPIPRRIAEEAGVSRSEFGNTKRGIGIGVSYFPTRMHPESYRSLRAFFQAHKHERSLLRECFYWVMYLTCLGIKVTNHYLGTKLPQFIPFRYVRNPGLASYMIPWGVSVVGERYLVDEANDAGVARQTSERSSDIPTLSQANQPDCNCREIRSTDLRQRACQPKRFP